MSPMIMVDMPPAIMWRYMDFSKPVTIFACTFAASSISVSERLGRRVRPWQAQCTPRRQEVVSAVA